MKDVALMNGDGVKNHKGSVDVTCFSVLEVERKL